MKTRSWLRTKLSQASTKRSGCLLLSKQTKHKQKQKHKVSTPKVPSQKRSTHLEPNFHMRAKASKKFPWTVSKVDGAWTFSTASEAEYPQVLAHRMVEAVTRVINPELLNYSYKALRLDVLYSVGKQTKRHMQLIPEFHHVEQLLAQPTDQAAKLLHDFDLHEPGEEEQGRVDNADKKRKTMKKFGIYFSPEQHIEKALKLPHPASEGISSLSSQLAWEQWRNREQTF